jgi:hypothetical protein
MFRQLFRLGLGAVVVLASLAVVTAQDLDKRISEALEERGAPKTPPDYWNRIKAQVRVGNYELAAQYLRAFLNTKPTDGQLLSIVDAVEARRTAIEADFRELRSVPRWSKDPKLDKQARDDVRTVIERIQEARRKRLGDPERIRQDIARLVRTPEERTYAVGELRKAGAQAMPALIDVLIKPRTPALRLEVLKVLEQMGPVAIPAMIAALDSDNPRLKLDLLDILHRRYARYAREIVPHLWYVAFNKSENGEVRKKATAILADFLDVRPSNLPPVLPALTHDAERYYQHQVPFPGKTAVIWRWTGRGVSQSSVPSTLAEEYWGLRFARQALDLDPGYQPAQVIFLSLAVEKAMQRGGLSNPLTRTAPDIAALVNKASTELLIEMLERGLKEPRTGVILATIRALGDRAEVRAKRPAGRRDAALVRALYYPDPRVQLAAVESLLLIPGPPAAKSSARIVEILTRLLTPAMSANPGRKVIVGIFEDDWRNAARTVVEHAGVQPIAVSNGRDLMRQVRARGDIDAILVESTLPQPGLANLLAQLRTDVDVGKVPVLLAAVSQTRASHDAIVRTARIDRRLDVILDDTRDYRAARRRSIAEQQLKVREIEEHAAKERRFAKGNELKLREVEKDRQTALNNAADEFAARQKELDHDYLASVLMLRPVPRQLERLDQEFLISEREDQYRRAQLETFTARYPNVRVVHASLFTNATALESVLNAAIRQSGVDLTPKERAVAAEVAVQILSRLAMGQPRGYDVTPATNVIAEALRTGRLSPRGQIAAIDALARLPGSRPQLELIHTILDNARPAAPPNDVRTAAAEALVQNIQRFGVQVTQSEFAPVRTLARQEKLPAQFKAQLAVLIGSLRPDARTTGERLKRYQPDLVKPLPPPKK